MSTTKAELWFIIFCNWSIPMMPKRGEWAKRTSLSWRQVSLVNKLITEAREQSECAHPKNEQAYFGQWKANVIEQMLNPPGNYSIYKNNLICRCKSDELDRPKVSTVNNLYIPDKRKTFENYIKSAINKCKAAWEVVAH